MPLLLGRSLRFPREKREAGRQAKGHLAAWPFTQQPSCLLSERLLLLQRCPQANTPRRVDFWLKRFKANWLLSSRSPLFLVMGVHGVTAAGGQVSLSLLRAYLPPFLFPFICCFQ